MYGFNNIHKILEFNNLKSNNGEILEGLIKIKTDVYDQWSFLLTCNISWKEFNKT